MTARKPTAAELREALIVRHCVSDNCDSDDDGLGVHVRMRCRLLEDADRLLAAARAEAVAEERRRVWKLAGDVVASRKATSRAVGYNDAYRAALDDVEAVLAAHEQRDLASKSHGADLMGAEAIAPLEARVAELTAALRGLVDQIGKAVGLPPPSHQCPPDHAYSDLAQAINAALLLLAKEPTP